MTFIVTAGVSSSTLNNASYAQVMQAAQPANQALLLEPRQVDMYLLDMRIRMQADSGRVHVQAQIGIANAAGKHAKLCIFGTNQSSSALLMVQSLGHHLWQSH